MRRARRSLSLLVLFTAFVLGGGPTPAWAAPPNDTAAGAEVVVLPAVIGPVDTTGATTDAVDADVAAACDAPGPVSNTVWYRFTPDEDGAVLVDTSGSDHYVVGAVLTGSPGAFAPESCFGGSTVVSVRAGTTYTVVLADGSGGGGGMLHLTLTPGEAPTAALELTGATVAKRTGIVTLRGTITCTDGAVAYLWGMLSQRVGRVATIQGSASQYVECDGSVQPWTATVQPFSGKFSGGKATFSYGVSVYSPFGSSFDTGTVPVQLRSK